MTLVIYSLVLNHHQAGIADELYNQLGNNFRFVELSDVSANKGGHENYASRPYLLRSWESPNNHSLALDLACSADVCVFAGYEALPFEKERLKRGLISFDMGERLLKRGFLNLLSPRILKMVIAYYWGRWKKKPLYKLCCSSFASQDLKKLGMFRNKCYKWGYFTCVDDAEYGEIKNNKVPKSIMWCGRLLTLKHPELAVEMARSLDAMGYDFTLDIYGDDGHAASYEKVYPRKKIENLIAEYCLSKKVKCHGHIPNTEVLTAMQTHDIFLFTSNKLEGWGAVANESMTNACVLIASDKIGSTDYLISHGVNGLNFENSSVSSLTEQVKSVLDDQELLNDIQTKAFHTMREVWSPKVAALRLLKLIDVISNGGDTPFISGPCSKA